MDKKLLISKVIIISIMMLCIIGLFFILGKHSSDMTFSEIKKFTGQVIFPFIAFSVVVLFFKSYNKLMKLITLMGGIIFVLPVPLILIQPNFIKFGGIYAIISLLLGISLLVTFWKIKGKKNE